MNNNIKEKTKEQNKDNTKETGQENPEVNIVIKQHPQLFELLRNPDAMWRVLLTLFLVLVVIFFGLACVVLIVKRYYPYNIIETNIQGATIMKSEDKEVIYWLFNTADLWANSGIEVHAGDELTIRASGASFTAIHHLVDASNANFQPDDVWVGTEGQHKDLPRDKMRAQYRIDKNVDEGILLMKIIPEDLQNSNENWINTASDALLTIGNIEVIGKERRNLRVSKTGILHFAVNDIVLTSSVIDSMYQQYIKDVLQLAGNKGVNIKFEDIWKQYSQTISDVGRDIISTENCGIMEKLSDWSDTLKCALGNDSIEIKKVIKSGLGLGSYPNICGKKEYVDALPFVNELLYYKQKRFRNAWYIDNLGSFLIVIERKK